MKLLEWLAKASAIAAGVLLTMITLMTCVSLIGRNTTGWTIVGDFELTGFAAGAAIALFLPWCQWTRGNIIVDFFTARLSARAQARLDAAGALLLALVMALVAWRAGAGALSVWQSGERAMISRVPQWIGYAAIVPSLALTALVGLYTAWESLRDKPRR
jgi:TRAP-type C4-dicarboxylate transport system permease small subunit